MALPEPKNYAEKVLFAIGEAVTDASTDRERKAVTYHRQDAARACLTLAAIMLNAKAEDAPNVTKADVERLVAATLFPELAQQDALMPDHVLNAERPGFSTRTLA